jgi:hypothetical protein
VQSQHRTASCRQVFEVPLSINVRGLRETVLLESGIVLWKVAKITDFLATFQVHPWTDLTSHEPVRQKTEWLWKLVQEPLCGS